MTYDPAVPQATDKPRISQGQFLINFGQINTQFGTEHTALDAATGLGKHKYVTLPRSAGIVPVGNDMVISQEVTGAGNPYLRARTSTIDYHVPFVLYVASVPMAGTGYRQIFDFAGPPLIAPMMGFVQIANNTAPDPNTRTLFSPFVWSGTNVDFPGNFSATGQVSGTSQYEYFANTGPFPTSAILVHCNAVPAGNTVKIVIWGSPL